MGGDALDRIASALERLVAIEETLEGRLLQNYQRAEEHWARTEEYLTCCAARDAVNQQRAAEWEALPYVLQADAALEVDFYALGEIRDEVGEVLG